MPKPPLFNWRQVEIYRRGEARERSVEPWIEWELADGWIAHYRLEAQDGGPVVAEIRIGRRGADPFPPHPDDVGDLEREPAPPGGLPARLLRQVPTQEVLRLTRDLVRRVKERWPEALSDPSKFWYKPGLFQEPRRPGRRGHPDKFYAEIARAYVGAVASGSRRPIADLAKTHHRSAPSVRDLVHEARERGLLTPSPAGRPGGQLTAEAKTLLSEGPKRARTKRKPKGEG